jgi:hypothetical protein
MKALALVLNGRSLAEEVVLYPALAFNHCGGGVAGPAPSAGSGTCAGCTIASCASSTAVSEPRDHAVQMSAPATTNARTMKPTIAAFSAGDRWRGKGDGEGSIGFSSQDLETFDQPRTARQVPPKTAEKSAFSVQYST